MLKDDAVSEFSSESKDLVFGHDDDVEYGDDNNGDNNDDNDDDNDDDKDDDDNDLSRSGTIWVRTMKRILLANQ